MFLSRLRPRSASARLRLLLSAAVFCSCPVAEGAAPRPAPLERPKMSGALFVCDSSMDRVVRLVDVDGSGTIDPDGEGEVIVFYDDDSPGPDLSIPSGIVLGPNGKVFLLDGGTLDSVFVLADQNADGDANDVGEYQIFFDNSTLAPKLSTPNALAFSSDGALWIIDDGSRRGLILRLEDDNGDGDALDDGEWTVAYDSREIGHGDIFLMDPEALAVGGDTRLYVADAARRAVFVFVDQNGDGDVMDSSEGSHFYTPAGTLPFEDPEGLAVGVDGELYATDEDTGLILRLVDRNGDGVASGTAEVVVFSDSQSHFAPRDTNDLLVSGAGELIVLDGSRDQVFILADGDGDDAATRNEEVHALIATGDRVLGTPSGLALAEGVRQASVRFRRGDVNADGVLNLTDPVFLLGFLFLGDEVPVCLDAADVNDDGVLAISDPVALLGYLFLGDEQPESPFEKSGLDPTEDALDCKAGAK